MSEVTEPKPTNDYFTFEDVLEARKNNAAGLKLKPYDPYTFWEGMGEKWYKTFDRREKFLSNVPWIVDRLRQFKVSNILDVGALLGGVCFLEPLPEGHFVSFLLSSAADETFASFVCSISSPCSIRSPSFTQTRRQSPMFANPDAHARSRLTSEISLA